MSVATEMRGDGVASGVVALGCVGVGAGAVAAHASAMALSTAPSATAALPAGVWTASGYMQTPHVDESTATVLLDGSVLVAGGDKRVAETYDPSAAQFTRTGDTIAIRLGHTATRLADGRVLVAGGLDGQQGVASAELYDPTLRSWSSTGTMHDGRYSHSALLLADGRVLVVGGWKDETNILATAELYDPVSGTWSGAGTLADTYGYPGAVLLPNGSALVVGGQNENGALASAELFDPEALSWTALPSMAQARSFASTTVLLDGRVLVAGGGAGDARLQSAELFDPSSRTWSEVARMTEPRSQHVGVRLTDGQVLLAGGGQTHNATAEIYDPTANTWTQTGRMTAWRASPLVALLADGRVLLGGGFTDDATSTEVFDPSGGGAVASVPPWFSRCEPGCQGPISGTFASAGFMPGLQLTIDAAGWFNSADYADELQLERDDDVVRFWRNPGASSPTGELLGEVPKTPDGLTQWLVGNPNVTASAPELMTIDGLAATTLTVTISTANVNADPECPPDIRSCLRLILVRQHHDFAIGYGEAVRLYLFSLDSAGVGDTIVISLDSPNSQRLAQLTADMQPILETVHLP